MERFIKAAFKCNSQPVLRNGLKHGEGEGHRAHAAEQPGLCPKPWMELGSAEGPEKLPQSSRNGCSPPEASMQLFYLNPEPSPAQRSAHGVCFSSMAPPVTAMHSSFDLGFFSAMFISRNL